MIRICIVTSHITFAILTPFAEWIKRKGSDNGESNMWVYELWCAYNDMLSSWLIKVTLIHFFWKEKWSQNGEKVTKGNQYSMPTTHLLKVSCNSKALFSLFLSLTTPRENQQLPKKRGMHKERVKGHVKELRLGAKQWFNIVVYM